MHTNNIVLALIIAITTYSNRLRAHVYSRHHTNLVIMCDMYGYDISPHTGYYYSTNIYHYVPIYNFKGLYSY